MEPIKIPLEDCLDLHTFNPKELPDLLAEYFRACIAEGLLTVRIIHGKGSGVLRKRVYAILKRDPRVVSFKVAPPEAGGWGATLVRLKKE